MPPDYKLGRRDAFAWFWRAADREIMLQKLVTCVGTNLAKDSLTARERMQFMQLRRREFIGLLGAAAACPCTAAAQSLQAVIGLVSIGASPTDPANFRPFLQQMGELGYADGRNIKFERRFAAGNDSLTKGFLADLVRRQVDDYRRHWHTRDHCRQRD